jgi:Carboxypeptidase regulatory-like domain
MRPRPTLFSMHLIQLRAMRVWAFALVIFGVAIFSLVSAAPVRAQMPGVISGVVLAPDGTPQAHARVYLQPGNGRPPRTVLTDATGHFSFGNTASGIYDVRAQANGLWSELIHNVSVKKNDEVSLKLQIKAAAPKTEKP